MKINIDWLRDFVSIDSSAEELAESLTLAGLEVDSVTPAAADFSGVVVAEILAKRSHPDADRLSVCTVTDGEREREIVCGAPNTAAGLKVPFAPVGTVLPGELEIRAAEIRGVRSEGMLCSAKELGLADDAAGLLVLDPNAATGSDLRQHLRLDDQVLDIDLTPNRGDCFSVLGVAREIAAGLASGPIDEALECVPPATDRTCEVELIDTDACPRFAGRVVSGLSTTARSPDWLRERLRRAGVRAIHPVVDVTNYVMLELGQPLHAYRLDRLSGPIQVRFATPGEQLKLLDATVLTLDDDTLVIADDSGAIGLAGIMGGYATGVDADTDTVFLESAFFAPAAMQGRARRYGLHTDASVRFERGVDVSGQERAVERATSLLLDITGGSPGPLVVAEDREQVPVVAPIHLREARVAALLGVDVSGKQISSLLERLDMQLESAPDGWQVTPPSYRFDVAIEEDLVEELGRMIGYDRIPVTAGTGQVRLGVAPEGAVSVDALSDFLVALGYREIVSFSFTESADQARITGADDAVRLANPISQDLDVMRSTLWPGLLRAAVLNQSHRQHRCRLFETGTVFAENQDTILESARIGGLITGSRQPVHWQGESPAADFFDLKGDIEALLSIWNAEGQLHFESAAYPALSPANATAVYCDARLVGRLGELHPALQRAYELKSSCLLFELDLAQLGTARITKFAEYSKYPAVYRDLAVIVDEPVTVAKLTKHVAAELGQALRRCEVFDIYRGRGVDSGRKSVAIGLILQDAYRTLNDEQTDDMMQRVMRRLERELGATIRS